MRKGAEIEWESPLLGCLISVPGAPRGPPAVILPAKPGKYAGHRLKEGSLHLISMIKKKKKKEATQTEKQN